MSGSIPPPSTFQIILWWLQYFSPVLQTLVFAVTGLIVWWYAKETQRLRVQSQKHVEAIHQQIEVSQQQVKVTQEQIEVMQRPFIVISPIWYENSIQKIKVRNIGNSAAINIEIIRDAHHKAIIPIIDSRDTFDIDVWEDSTQGRTLNSVLKVFCQEKHPTMDAIEENVLFLDPTSRSQGVILKIEYCNVAMMQYHTTERIFPTGVIIESSGKMGPYVWNR